MEMTHETILKMIEEVDPNDRAKLDEIDFDVCMWLIPERKRRQIERGFTGLYHIPKYTRSRDALKSIRPIGWGYDHDVIFDKWAIVGYMTEGFAKDFPCVESPILPTEELAELHAIIQSIAYDRSKS